MSRWFRNIKWGKLAYLMCCGLCILMGFLIGFEIAPIPNRNVTALIYVCYGINGIKYIYIEIILDKL